MKAIQFSKEPKNADPRFNHAEFIDWQTLVGKTIEAVDTEHGQNVVIVKFSDGSKVVVDTEPIGHGMHTPVIAGKV